MQVHTLDKASVINELQFGTDINQAVQQGRHADFALFMALFSNDVRDTCPTETLSVNKPAESQIRQHFAVAEPQPLRNNQSSYAISAQQAKLFHSGGLASAKLTHYLTPEPLTYLPEDTGNLPEEVYLNLSAHERRQLKEKSPITIMSTDIYRQLNQALRQDQLRVQC